MGDTNITTTPTTTTTTTGNPLKDDEELRRLLKDLESIDSKREFRRWKASFLQKMEGYVAKEHRQPAEARYQSFATSMGKLSKLVKTLYLHLQKGHLSKDNTTVKARRCLSELKEQIEQVMAEINTMLPRTKEEEKKVGYSKFHLGAVLVQDGFVEYDRLCICDEIMQHMRSNVFGGADDDDDNSTNEKNNGSSGRNNEGAAVALDRQILDNMGQFHHRINIFCDVMADLGLYKAMIKCRELMKLEEEEEEDDEGNAKDEEDNNKKGKESKGKNPTVAVRAPDPPASPRKSKKGDGFRFTLTTPSDTVKKTIGKDTAPGAPNLSASSGGGDNEDGNNNHKEHRPEKAGFNKFGHYYHGNSADWRIAASLRNNKPTMAVAEGHAGGGGTANKSKEEEDAQAPPKADKQKQQQPKALEESNKVPVVHGGGKRGQGAAAQSNFLDSSAHDQTTDSQSTNKDGSASTNKGQGPLLQGPQEVEHSAIVESASSATPVAPRINGKQSQVDQTDEFDRHSNDDDNNNDDTEGEWTNNSVMPKNWETVLGPLGADGCPKTFRGMADAGLSGSIHSGREPVSQSRSLLSANSDNQDNQEEDTMLLEHDKDMAPQKNENEEEASKRRADRHQSLPNAPSVKAPASPVKRGSQNANTTAAPSPLVGARRKLKNTNSRASVPKKPTAAPRKKEGLRTPPGTPTKVNVRKVESPFKRTKNTASESSPTRSPKGKVQKGAPPLQPPPLTNEPMGENFGYAVDISSEGIIIAAGSPRHGKNSKGRARVFCLDDDTGEWTQIGQDLIGKADNDTFGASVSLSADCQIVAVGSPQLDTDKSGYVRVYQYNDDDNYWASLGRPIEGAEPHESFGWSVSLSSNGSRLVVGGPHGNKQDGVVRIYMYHSESRQWTQLGNDIRGDGFGASVATTASGHVAASGSARQGDAENAHAFSIP